MKRSNGRERVELLGLVGTFAEDKDAARQIRTNHILPAVRDSRGVVLDFKGVSVATQSFVHALVSEALRVKGREALDLIEFKNCSRTVKSVVLTVVDYSIDSEDAPRTAEKAHT